MSKYYDPRRGIQALVLEYEVSIEMGYKYNSL
jgi:hypothetical protein